MRFKKNLLSAAFLGFLAFPAAADAAQILTAAPGTIGNQNFGGDLGIDFTVNSPIAVTSLGAFTNGLSDISVSLYSLTGGAALAAATIAPGALGADQYAFSSLTVPITLLAGNYQITASGYDGLNELYNPDGGTAAGSTTSTLIAFNSLGGTLSSYTPNTGAFYNVPPPGGVATTLDIYTPNYGAGNFIASAVPEPASWIFLILGFGLVGWTLRGRHSLQMGKIA